MPYKTAIIDRLKNLLIINSCFVMAGGITCGNCYAESTQTTSSGLISFIQPTKIGVTHFNQAIEENSWESNRYKKYIPGIEMSAHGFGSDEIRRLALDNVLIGPKTFDNYIELLNGNVLLNPDRDIVVEAAEAKIQIGGGSAVFIVKNDHSLTLYDLHQAKPRQISVTFDKHKLFMEPGQLICLSTNPNADCDRLGSNYRPVVYNKVQKATSNEESINVFVGEFSLVEAFITIAPLQRLTVSNNAQDKKFLEMLTRDAVVLGDEINPLKMAHKQ